MGKVIDITDKLNFEGNPIIRVKGQDLEVQAGAENMLRILGLFGSGKTEMQAAAEAIEMLFNKEDRKKIEKLKLSIKDYMTVIKEAINAATDGGDDPGEQ